MDDAHISITDKTDKTIAIEFCGDDKISDQLIF